MKENDYFIIANSFIALTNNDTSKGYITGIDENDAMEKFKKNYNHPAGLFAANLYKNEDDYHKNKKPLLMFRQP